MEFELNKEQTQVLDAVRAFSKKELYPQYMKWDREKIFPRHLWKQIGDLGLIGMNVVAEDGGMGFDYMTLGIAAEEMAKGDVNMAAVTFVESELFVSMTAQGTETVKRKFLYPMLKGDIVSAFAMTEPHCGSDAVAMTTSATKKGLNYVLNGEKSGISMNSVADVAVVFAKTDPHAGARGVSAFVVPTDLPGISCQSYDDLGCRLMVRGSMFLDNVEIPEAYLLGKEGEGFKLGMKSFDASRVFIALICIGAARISLEETISYTKERHAFNRPLAKYEGVSFPVVEHESILEAVRLLCYKALWLRDNGKPHTKEAGMAKWMAPKFSVDAIRDCLLLHGHYGYTEDLPLGQRLRDVIGWEIGDGTSQISKLVVSREIFGREYLPY
ncbi:acyl-CoA dehydrogenase family protein [Thermodesulfobacteriota bacterium]